MARYIYQVHIADGFVDDCEELIHRCSQFETLTFEKFTQIWKDMNMASFYNHRKVGAEVAELSEELLQIAKRYMVANTSNFEESVAGLFLVYGLLNLQPYKGFAALRLVPDDVPAVSRIELVARRDRRLDILYILGEVLVRGPLQCHAEGREYGFDHSLRKYLEGVTSIDKLGIRPKGVFYRQNEELDIIRELSNLTRLYDESKANISGGSGRKDPNLSYADKNLPKELDSSLKKIINGFIDEGDKVFLECEQNTRSDMVRAIKARAMKNTIDPIKHLTGVKERETKKSSTVPEDKSETVTKPGRAKTGSPVKQDISGSPWKRKLWRKTPKRRKKRPKKKHTYISSDSGSEGLEDFSISDDDRDENIVELDDGSDNDDDDNDFDSRRERRVEVEIDDINKLNEPTENESIVQKEYEVQINSMPVIIKNNTDENMEIELLTEGNVTLETDELNEARSRLIQLPARSESELERPGTSTERPGTSTERSGTSKERPGTSTERPGTSTERPGTSTERPGTSTERPGTSTERPGTSTERPGTSTERLGTSKQDVDDTTTPSASKAKDGNVFKKPENFKLRKLEKRDLKKTILKSKFKRMGLEPIANFVDTKKSKIP